MTVNLGYQYKENEYLDYRKTLNKKENNQKTIKFVKPVNIK